MTIAEASSAAATDTPLPVAAPAPQAPSSPPATPAQPASPAAPEPAKTAPEPTPEPPKTAAEKARAAIDGILKKPEKAKPTPQADDEKIEGLTDDEIKTAKAHPKAWSVVRTLEKKWKERQSGFTSKTAELEKRIAELSANAPSAANDAKLKALEKQLEDLGGKAKTYQQKLAERDFRESDEYQEKFVTPWNRAYGEAYSFVKGLHVLNAEGEPERQATEADFNRVMAAQPQQRRLVAKELFGEDFAGDVVDFTKELGRLKRSADEAIASHSQNWEKIAQEREAKSKQEQEQFGQFKTDAQRALEAAHPEYFSAEHYKDQPELQAALKSGYEYLDKAEADMGKMMPDDRAATVAVIRSRAAAFPLLYHRTEALKQEVESLKAELAKFRQSDPGSAPAANPPTPPAEPKVGGISEMSAKFADM